jgi:hypothetical protein
MNCCRTVNAPGGYRQRRVLWLGLVRYSRLDCNPLETLMRRIIRVVISCLCLVLCSGLVGLWVYGYYSNGSLSSTYYTLTFEQGYVRYIHGTVIGGWWDETLPKKMIVRANDSFCLYMSDKSHRWGTIPNWLLTLSTGTLAILLKPKPRLKFSLLDLLLFTTIAAIVLGTVTTLARLTS